MCMVCQAVTDRQCEAAQGARTLKDLRRELGVTRDCGRCASCSPREAHGEAAQGALGSLNRRLPACSVAARCGWRKGGPGHPIKPPRCRHSTRPVVMPCRPGRNDPGYLRHLSIRLSSGILALLTEQRPDRDSCRRYPRFPHILLRTRSRRALRRATFAFHVKRFPGSMPD